MISVVVPVYNSEKTLEMLCNEIAKVMIKEKQSYEIILVNDGSKDKSKSLINHLVLERQHIIGIDLAQNYGQQNALLCGLRYCAGEYVITIDDDLQFHPNEISKLLYTIKEGYDVVYGVPHIKSHGKLRNIGSKFKESIFQILLKKPKHITITSFRIIRRSIVDKIVLDTSSFVYLSAITFKHTQKVANVKVNHYQRIHGKSNYSYIKLFRLMIKIVIYYSNCPLFIPLRNNRPQYIVKEIIK